MAAANGGGGGCYKQRDFMRRSDGYLDTFNQTLHTFLPLGRPRSFPFLPEGLPPPSPSLQLIVCLWDEEGGRWSGCRIEGEGGGGLRDRVKR